MPVFNYELSTSSAVIFTIGIGLSVDNTIHFMSRFRELRASNMGLEETIREAFRSSGQAIIASNILLTIGFSTLIFNDFEPSQRLAVLTVTTILTALVSAILILPALLILFERPQAGESKVTTSQT